MARRLVTDELADYNAAKTMRSFRENDWRLASAYCLPQHYGSWSTEGPATYGPNGPSSARRVVFDPVGTRSLPKYMAVLERLATPAGSKYQGLAPSDKNLLKSTRVKQYFDDLTDLIFKYRDNPYAGFRSASNEVYGSMGVYGTGPIFVGQRPKNAINKAPGFMYKACPMRDIFFLVDDDGNVCVVYRRFWLNVRQFRAKFPKEELPKCMEAEAKKASPDEARVFEFVHVVRIRSADDHDPKAIDARRHPVASNYMCVEGQEYVGEETGYLSLPYLTPRTFTIAGDAYGFSPAQLALSSLGGASAIKKTYLKQGNKAVDPVLLVHDDGALNGEVDQRPGAVINGGLDRQGRKLVQALETGNFQVAERLLEMDIAAVEDCFFVTLFTVLKDRPEMTATQIVEEAAQVAAMVSPTMGRLQTEFLGPMTQREIDMLVEIGAAPQMPPELVEAQGEFDYLYTSPLAKSVYAEETSGFMRTVEMALGVAQATQDTSHLDHFDFDTAIPEIAFRNGAPSRWMKDAAKIASDRSDRADNQETQMLMQNAGGLAQAAKAAGELEATQ